MAGSTFLVLTNKLLRRLNEVELTTTTFASAKNVQAMAKDAIIAAIAEIDSSEYQWPWNVQTGQGRVTTTDQFVQFGTVDNTTSPDGDDVNIPATSTAVPEWASFRIAGTAEVGGPGFTIEPVANAYTLQYISQEEWLKYYRQLDLAADPTTGKDIPRFVFPYTNAGFGVSPMPNDTYIIEYEMYIVPAELSADTDECSIPTVWDYVVINMALKHYYMYKDNVEAAGYWINESNKTFAKMRNAVVNRPDSVWSNMVNFGGQKWSMDYTKV